MNWSEQPDAMRRRVAIENVAVEHGLVERMTREDAAGFYQLQAQVPEREGRAFPPRWFAATVSPVDWKLLLGMVKLWRETNPDCRLRAVRWEEAIRR